MLCCSKEPFASMHLASPCTSRCSTGCFRGQAPLPKAHSCCNTVCERIAQHAYQSGPSHPLHGCWHPGTAASGWCTCVLPAVVSTGTWVICSAKPAQFLCTEKKRHRPEKKEGHEQSPGPDAKPTCYGQIWDHQELLQDPEDLRAAGKLCCLLVAVQICSISQGLPRHMATLLLQDSQPGLFSAFLRSPCQQF